MATNEQADWPDREKAMGYMRAMVGRWAPEYPCRDTCFDQICRFAPVCKRSATAVYQFEEAYDDWEAAGGKAAIVTDGYLEGIRTLTPEEKQTIFTNVICPPSEPLPPSPSEEPARPTPPN
jgi:hypothetical protein